VIFDDVNSQLVRVNIVQYKFVNELKDEDSALIETLLIFLLFLWCELISFRFL
jgi:hypothetical protein